MSNTPEYQDRGPDYAQEPMYARDFATSGGFTSPRGPRKVSQTSLTSNESSESDDNIVLPRPVQSPIHQQQQGQRRKPAFSPFAPEFCPGGEQPDFPGFGMDSSNMNNSGQQRRDSSSTSSSSKAPSTPGLIDFDSPESVNSPLETPDKEAPQAHQSMRVRIDDSSRTPFFQFEPSPTDKASPQQDGSQLEIADEILRLQLSPLDRRLPSYAEHQQQQSPSSSQQPVVSSGLRRMSSPPPSSSASKLHASARPWSPSPLRYEQRPGSTATASTVTPGPRDVHWPLSPHAGNLPHPQHLGMSKVQRHDDPHQQQVPRSLAQMSMHQHSRGDQGRSRLSHVEAGEPEDSFPYSAFTQWKQQQSPPSSASLQQEEFHNNSNMPSRSAASPFMNQQRRPYGHSRHGSDASSRGSSVDMYDLTAQPRSHSRTSTHGRNGLASPSPSALPLSFAQRQQQRQSAVLAASMASARRSSGSSHGSSAAFDLPVSGGEVQYAQQPGSSLRVRATPPPPLSSVSQMHHNQSLHQYEQAPLLPGAGLPGAGLPPAPSPANYPISHTGTPSPGPAADPMATLYHLNQLGFDPQTSDAILHLASTQPKLFVQLAGKSGSSSSGSQGGPSPHNRKLSLYKTELCRSWEEKGSCRYGVRPTLAIDPEDKADHDSHIQAKCQFAHGPEELRVINRHPKYKTQVCRTYWVTGSCPYGRRCCFLHNVVPSSTTPLSPAGPNDPPVFGQEHGGNYAQPEQDPNLHAQMPYYPQGQARQGQPSPFYGEQGYRTGSSMSHSRSSSASSNLSRGAFEPTEADRRLLGRAPAGGLMMHDADNDQRQQLMQQHRSNSQNSQQYTEDVWRPSSRDSTQGAFSSWSRPPHQYSTPTGIPFSRSSSSSLNSYASGGPHSPFSPAAADPFHSPTSASTSAMSPYTPLSSVTTCDPWKSPSTDERAFAAFHSAQEEVVPSQPNLKLNTPSASYPNYSSFGAIGASRKSQPSQQRSPAPLQHDSDQADDQNSSSSALAQHARFLSQLAASGGSENGNRDLDQAQGPQDAY